MDSLNSILAYGSSCVQGLISSVSGSWNKVASQVNQVNPISGVISSFSSDTLIDKDLTFEMQVEKFKIHLEINRSKNQSSDALLGEMETYYTTKLKIGTYYETKLKSSSLLIIIQGYLESENYDKIYSLLQGESYSLLTESEVFSFLRQLNQKIKDTPNEKQQVLLEFVLPLTIERANAIQTQWVITDWSGGVLSKENQENKLCIYLEVASLYRKMNETSVAEATLDCASSLFKDNQNKELTRPIDVSAGIFHAEMFFLYAIAHHSLNDKKTSSEFLNNAKLKLESIKDIDQRLKALIQLSKIEPEFLAQWEEGQKFFQVNTEGLTPAQLFLVASLYKEIPSLKESGKEILGKISSNEVNSFELAKLYKDYEVEIPNEIMTKCETVKNTISQQKLSKDNISVIQTIILSYEHIGDHTTALAFLNEVKRKLTNVQSNDQWLILQQLVQLFFTIKKHKEGQEFCKAFLLTNPQFLIYCVSISIENAEKLFQMGQTEHAKKMLDECKKSLKEQEKLKFVQVCNKIDPNLALQVIDEFSGKKKITPIAQKPAPQNLSKPIPTPSQDKPSWQKIVPVVLLIIVGMAAVSRSDWYTRTIKQYKPGNQ